MLNSLYKNLKRQLFETTIPRRL